MSRTTSRPVSRVVCKAFRHMPPVNTPFNEVQPIELTYERLPDQGIGTCNKFRHYRLIVTGLGTASSCKITV